MATPPPPQGGYLYPPQQSAQPGAYPAPGGYVPPAQGEYPAQGGYPAPGAFPPPPAAPRRSSLKTIKNIAIVVAFAVIAVGGWIASRDDANTAAVGDCMHRGGTSSTSPDLEVVDCGDTKAQYMVLAKIEGSFSEDEADTKCAASAKDFQYAYTETGDGSSFLLCLKDK